jgi:hypothetical protein
MPILAAGAETWAWTKAEISRLKAAEIVCLRNAEGKQKWRD